MNQEPGIFQDPYWRAALDFTKQHVGLGETLVAPVNFAFYLPRTRAYSQFRRGRDFVPDWVLFHKDCPKSVTGFDVHALRSDYVPVWANEVFILFQYRPGSAIKKNKESIWSSLRRRFFPTASSLPVQATASSHDSPAPAPGPGEPSRTAIVLTSRNRPAALARSLPQLTALKTPILLVIDGNSSIHEAAYNAILASNRSPLLEVVHLPCNLGLAGALNTGLFFWLADPSIQWISYFQDDVDVHPDIFRELARIQNAREYPMLSGRLSPGYPLLGDGEINGIQVKKQWGSSGQHLHGHRSYWESVLPIPTTQTGTPCAGQSSEVDWWITVMAPASLWKNSRPTICLPGLVRHFCHRPEDSTWGLRSAEDPPLRT